MVEVSKDQNCMNKKVDIGDLSSIYSFVLTHEFNNNNNSGGDNFSDSNSI